MWHWNCTPHAVSSLCDDFQMRTTCSITITCVVTRKRRNFCCWGNHKLLLALLRVGFVLRGMFTVKMKNSPAPTHSLLRLAFSRVFPAIYWKIFQQTTWGEIGRLLPPPNFPRTTSNSFSDRPDLIRSVCLRDFSTQHNKIPWFFAQESEVNVDLWLNFDSAALLILVCGINKSTKRKGRKVREKEK